MDGRRRWYYWRYHSGNTSPRVPARFAIGALAAFRLVPLLADEWELLTLARRARGFDSHLPRSVARPQRFTAADAALVAGALVVASVAIGTSVATGTFRPLI
jgi:energy-coupling factor transport system permease protein